MSNYLQINKCAIADGPGVRISVYFAGCPLHCPGCHNQESWDFEAGEKFTHNQIYEVTKAAMSDYISGISILGGEPLSLQNIEAVKRLLDSFKFLNPGKSAWLWTGYEWNELMHFAQKHATYRSVLYNIDVIVVGRFKIDERDITKENLWRGSRNQRVIDCKESLKVGELRPLKNIPNNEIA